MTEKNCIFCGGPVRDGQDCPWCGFHQSGSHVRGTLPYGAKLNNYVIADVVDMDGVSTSYLAYDKTLQRRVIIKEYLPVSMVGPRNGDNVEVQPDKEVLFKNLMLDFRDLYISLAKIESPAIQKIYDIFNANGTVYAVLENVKGESLKKTMLKSARPYTFKEARWLFRDIFRLLGKLRENNLAHGGISDDTVIITPDGNAVLTDFAIRDLRVKNDHVMYKLYDGFSAPEQYNVEQFSGFYTDIYSVAALFYYVVTGKNLTPNSFDGRVPELPKCAINAIKFATKPNPEERIDNIEDFVLILDDKAVAESANEPKKENPLANLAAKLPSGFDKKYVPYIMVAAVILIFAIAILGLGRQKRRSKFLFWGFIFIYYR